MKANTFDIITWGLRIISALIMLQTLFFKFTAAPESVYIFTKIGMEPYGRLGIGTLELIASALILFPKTVALGATLAVGLMAGAMFFHLTVLGLVVMDDGGQLFIYALIVFISSLVLSFLFRTQLFDLVKLDAKLRF